MKNIYAGSAISSVLPVDSVPQLSDSLGARSQPTISERRCSLPSFALTVVRPHACNLIGVRKYGIPLSGCRLICISVARAEVQLRFVGLAMVDSAGIYELV